MRILGLIKMKETKYIDLKYKKLILNSFRYNYQHYLKDVFFYFYFFISLINKLIIWTYYQCTINKLVLCLY